MNRLNTPRAALAVAVLALGLQSCSSTGETLPRMSTNDGGSSAKAVEAGMSTSKNMPKGSAMSSLAVPTGDPKTSTVLLEKFAPSQVVANNPFEYEVKVTNLTTMYLDNVAVHETLPSGMQLEMSEPKSAAGPNGSLVWNLGTLEPRESRSILVRGKATKEGSFSACSNVSYDTGVCMPISVIQPALKVAASGTRSAILCDDLDYRYTVSNAGTGTARNVIVQGNLPANVTYKGKSTISQKIGDLKAGESREFKIAAKASRTGSYTHSVTAAADGGLKASSGEVTTDIRQPMLKITKTGPKTSFIGRTLSYEITVQNTGNGVAANTVVTDTMPAGSEFGSATTGGKLSKGRVVWNLGDLAPNATKKVTVKLKPKTGGRITNRATVEADCADPVSAQAVTEVTGIPAVLLEVIDLEDPVEVGSEVTYLVKVTNQGTAPGHNVTVTCTLPGNVAFVRGDGTTSTSASGNRLDLAPIPSLAAGKEASWRITVRGVSEADARFRVEMKTDEMRGEPVLETESTNFYE